MIISFKTHLSIGKAKRKTPDSEEARSLIIQSEERLSYAKSKAISEKTAKFVMEDSYEAMRESAQALMSAAGFKPYSHEATISFIDSYCKQIFTDEDINRFDKFRQLRNDSIYRAIKITEPDAEECLEFAKYFLTKAKKALRKVK